jgi:pimeloyl-ACP methyl ester carboxylesterase
MSDYIQQFEVFYTKHKQNSNYVLGFSYGAVIALSTAQKLGVEKLFLCSLSPDFSEDVIDMQEWIKKYIGSRRLADCLTRSGRDLAKALTIPTIVFYGEKEAQDFPKIKVRARETVKLAKDAKLVVVVDAPHDISFPTYKAAIERLFQGYLN